MKEFCTIVIDSIKGGRDYQDDYYDAKKLKNGASLLILADGMGGYAGGRVASERVIKSFQATFDENNPDIKDALHKALIQSNEDLAIEKKKQPKLSQMGTTLIAVYITPTFMQWVSVGDSPLWVIKKRGRLHQYEIKRENKNHSIAGLLELQFQHGEIDKEERDSSPNRHMLTSAITGDELKSIDLSKKFPLEEGDVVILASDGVETLSEKEIENIVINNIIKEYKPEKAKDDIIREILAKEIPNQDNSTLIIISMEKLDSNKENNITHTEEEYIDNRENIPQKSFLSQILSLDKLIYLSSFIAIVLTFILIKVLIDYEKVKSKLDSNNTNTTYKKEIVPISSKGIDTQIKEDNRTKKIEKIFDNNETNTTYKKEIVPISSKGIEIQIKEDNRTKKIEKSSVDYTKEDNQTKDDNKRQIRKSMMIKLEVKVLEYYKPFPSLYRVDESIYDDYTENLNEIKN